MVSLIILYQVGLSFNYEDPFRLRHQIMTSVWRDARLIQDPVHQDLETLEWELL